MYKIQQNGNNKNITRKGSEIMKTLNKPKLIILLLLVIAALTLVSYSIALNLMLNDEIVLEKEKEKERNTPNTLSKTKIFSGTVEIKLNIIPKNEIVTIEKYNSSELKSLINNDLMLKNIETYFYDKGFILQSSGNEKMIFMKNTKYIPEKFYLGSYQGHIAILKCNNSGDLVVENTSRDISRKTLEDVPISDREFIKNNEYIFENKEEALDELAALES